MGMIRQEIKDLFVSYDLAERMDNMGYVGVCFGYYRDSETLRLFDVKDLLVSSKNVKVWGVYTIEYVLAPLWQQAFDWFASTYGLWGDCKPLEVGDEELRYIFSIREIYKEGNPKGGFTPIGWKDIDSGKIYKDEVEAKKECILDMMRRAVMNANYRDVFSKTIKS